MKKMLLAVAGLAVAFAVAGCGSSPESVAEKFAKAVIEKNSGKAAKYHAVSLEAKKATMKAIKEELDELGKKINDEKLDVVAIDETIQIPAKDSGYQINNGHKITGERASVTVQFKKDSDLKSQGMELRLEKVDGNWLVTKYELTDNLDTSDK